jgi:hypothetical protein
LAKSNLAALQTSPAFPSMRFYEISEKLFRVVRGFRG